MLVQETFPNSVRKRLGGNRHSYDCGIEPIPQVDPLTVPDPDSVLTLELLEVERRRNRELEMEVNTLRADNESLRKRVAELENQQSSIPLKMELEMDSLLNPRNDVFHCPNTVEHFKSFLVDNILAEIGHQAPDVYHLLCRLARKGIEDGDENADSLKTVIALCTLLKGRSVRVLGVQLLITFMLIARATSKQVNYLGNYGTDLILSTTTLLWLQAITALNHAGVCVSYWAAWKYLRTLANEALYLERVHTDHWIWVFDNLNFRKHVRHERQGMVGTRPT